MKVAVYSIDETELSPVPLEFDNVIPFNKPPQLETCLLLWEGELNIAPVEGDALVLEISGGKSAHALVVILRVFHLELDEPLLALFVSHEEDGHELS